MSDEEINMEILLDHYRSPRNYGKIDNPSVQLVEYNPVCGDAVQFSLRIDNGILTDVKFIGRGCSVSQGAASILTEKVKGRSTEEIMNIGAEEILKNIGLNLGPSREKCALLSLNALQKSVKKYRDGKNE